MQDRVIGHPVIGLGHNGPPAGLVAASWLAGRRAVIRRRARPVETAGRAHENTWILTFARESPPEIEPLMGWTGGDDTLATEVELTFPTRAEAIAYAERQGLAYSAEPEPVTPVGPRPVTPAAPAWQPGRRRPPRGQQPRPRPDPMPDLERALINPAAVFDDPAAVLDHPRLLPTCKREILRRWAWDEYLKDVAATEGMAEGEPSRLDAVKAALLALGEHWRPHPAAPAAALPAIRETEEEPRRAAA
ncbi:MAG: ETC complex I subunit [Actinomycetospora chiangmaiensis]|nr:ETC complex I subunit [Actinomycetospora chiangmaiensis]